MANKPVVGKKVAKFSYTLILGLLFLIGGLFLVVFSSVDLNKINFYRGSKPSQIAAVNPMEEFPSKIFVPKIGKYLSIEEGQVENNRWKISQIGVSYLASTPKPGGLGNTVMYGHNTDNILGRMQELLPGDKIYILSDKGTILKYRVAETKQIAPSQVEILNQTNDRRLTIYTCSGFLDQARFVVVAFLEAV